MFWRKKKNKKVSLTYESDNKRSSFRYYPPESDSFYIRIDDNTYKVDNISAAGIAFKNVDFKKGEIKQADFNLPMVNTSMSISLSILFIDHLNICHCEFLNMSDGETDAIHQYVFEKQMQDLRNNE